MALEVRGVHYLLGIPATVLAAIAGATAFAANVPASVVGGCAGAAAALAGLQTLLHADQKSRFNHLQRTNLERLVAEIKSTRIEIAQSTGESVDALRELRRLQKEFYEVREHRQPE
jgi:hypothetical protein